MRNEVIIGKKGNYLVTAEFEYDHGHFSCCFNGYEPHKEDEYDDDYVQDWLDGCDYETLYKLCEHYECAPSELAYNYRRYTNIRDMIDWSSFCDDTIINEDCYFYTFGFGGQYDIWEESAEGDFVPREGVETLVRKLYDLWKNYHLKTMPESLQHRVHELQTQLAMTEIEKQKYIHDHLCDYFDLVDLDEEDEDED